MEAELAKVKNAATVAAEDKRRKDVFMVETPAGEIGNWCCDAGRELKG
jgi:hypothetical protein